jgi:transcriptional regulator
VTLTAFLFWGLLPLLLVIAAVDLLTMSQPRRVRMLRRSGMTQAAIADRLGVSRYRVRCALA